MWLRRVHRLIGLVLAPFLLLTAVGGAMVIAWRLKWYRDFDLREWFLEAHNLEAVGPWAGLVLALGLALMACTGVALWLQMTLRKRRSRRAAKVKP